MPPMLIRLNKITQISFMAAFCTPLLSILDPNTNSHPSLGSELGLGLGLRLGLGFGLGLGVGFGLGLGLGWVLG